MATALSACLPGQVEFNSGEARASTIFNPFGPCGYKNASALAKAIEYHLISS